MKGASTRRAGRRVEGQCGVRVEPAFRIFLESERFFTLKNVLKSADLLLPALHNKPPLAFIEMYPTGLWKHQLQHNQVIVLPAATGGDIQHHRNFDTVYYKI